MKTPRHWFVAWLLVSGCSKNDIPKGVPDCIAQRIKQLEAASVANPPARVVQYTYNGQTVYYIPPKCCDIPSILLDESCNSICAPDGGLTGRGDGKCTDFFQKRTNEKVIWADSRK